LTDDFFFWLNQFSLLQPSGKNKKSKLVQHTAAKKKKKTKKKLFRTNSSTAPARTNLTIDHFPVMADPPTKIIQTKNSKTKISQTKK